MMRWMVAGLLLVVLVGLIMMDEMKPAEPTVAPPDVFTPAGEVAVVPAAVPASDDPYDLTGGENTLEHAEHVARDAAKSACDPVVAVLAAELSEEKRDAIGDAMYIEKKMTPEAVAELCRSMVGQPPEVVVTRFLEVSGVTR
jgi:hypothetical protein